METCYVREVISHIRVIKFCVLGPVFLRLPSAHFTVPLFWREEANFAFCTSVYLSDGIYANGFRVELRVKSRVGVEKVALLSSI